MRTRTSNYSSVTRPLSLVRGLIAALFCGVLVIPAAIAQENDICAGVSEAEAGPPARATCVDSSVAPPSWISAAYMHIPGIGAFNPSAHVKTLKVRIVVWQHSSRPNFTNDSASIAYLTGIISRVEQEHFVDLHPPSDPSPYMLTTWPGPWLYMPGSCPHDSLANWYECVPETYLRLELSGVDFIQHDVFSAAPCPSDSVRTLMNALVASPQHAGPASLADLKLHIVTDTILGYLGAASSPLYQGNYLLGDLPHAGVSSKYTLNEDLLVRHWAHELGHCMGLMHTYGPGAAEACSNIGGGAMGQYYLHDVLGYRSFAGTLLDSIPRPDPIECNGCCSSCYLAACAGCNATADPWDRCINNIMGNNVYSRSVSPLQMGRMHSMMMVSGTANYAWGYDSIPFRFESFYELLQAPIVNTLSIDNTVKFYQDVHVPAGVVVTVKCEVDMVPEARWVVEPGGKLIIDGGIIRAAVFSPQRWRGVEVWGDNDQANVPHSVTALANADLYEHHGSIVLINGGEIQDAEIGILSGSRDDPSQGGGIIQVDGTHQEIGGYIRNCPIGVEFKPYNMKANASRFTNAHFLWDEDALPGDLGTNLLEHMRIVDVAGTIPIRGCTFANDLPTHTESLAMGHGIKGHNARIVVDHQCPGGPCPNTFRDLDHGIHATSTGNGSIRIHNNTFIDNICGVYLSGTVAASIMNNDFEVGRWNVVMNHPDQEHWLDSHRAIFSTGSYGFTMKDNTITPPQADPAVLTEGIVVGYTYDHNDVVYRNQASGLERGFIGEGVSADVDGGQANWIGLQFECNENVGNATNLMSRKANGATPLQQADHTIRSNQGAKWRAAGNLFDQEEAGFDFEMNTTQVPKIQYYYGVLTPDLEPWYYTQDSPISEVYPFQVSAAVDPENYCDLPQGLIGGIGELLAELEESRVVYGSTRYLYDQLIDDGSTDELVLEITSTWPQNMLELRDRLLGLSPYLSTASLMSLVETAGVPDAIKAEVCIANPDATRQEGFIEWAAEEAMYPLPPYIIDLIVNSWYEETYRGEMESLMAGQHSAMTQLVNAVVQLYEDDGDVDSVLWVWGRLRTNAARYAEAALLMAEGRFAEADSLVEAIPEEREQREKEESERTRMLAYIGILAGADAQDRSAHELDSAEVAQLALLVGEHYDRPAVWASNLLCAHYQTCRAPYTGGDVEPKAQKPRGRKRPISSGAMLTAHPNPADTWVALSHHVPGNTTALHLVVRDMAGRVVQTFTAGGEQGQTLWDIRNVSPAVYAVELVQAGRTLETLQVVVQP